MLAVVEVLVVERAVLLDVMVVQEEQAEEELEQGMVVHQQLVPQI
jgi:hypothetical protein